MYKLNLYFFIAFLIFSFRIFSQELLFEKPHNLTNLPSNECYNIIQDKKGYIWFSTDAGLCKYDGNKVKVFSKKEGLPEESCYGIVADSKGQLYIISSSNRILKIINDSLHELNFTKAFQMEMAKNNYLSTDFKIINDSLFIVNTQVNTFKVNIKTNRFEIIWPEKFNHQFNIEKESVYSRKTYISIKEFRRKKEANVKLKIIFNKKTFITQFNNSFNPTGTKFRIKTCVKGKTLFIGFGTALIKIDESEKTESISFKDEIQSIAINKEGNLFVGLKNLGLISISNATSSLKNKDTILKDFSVTGIELDRSGGIWCSTLENGILYCENPDISIANRFPFKNIKSSVFKRLDSMVWISDMNGDLWKTDGINYTYYPLKIAKKKFTTDILSYNEAFFIGTDKGILKYDKNIQSSVKVCLENMKIGNSAKNFIILNSKIYAINHTSLFEIKNNIMFEKILYFKSKVTSLVTNYKQLFLIKEDGIFSVDTSNYTEKLFYSLTEIKRAEFFKTSETYDDFAALTKEGFYVIKNGKKIDYDFNKIENIRINEFYLDSTQIWLATNIGIIEIPNYHNTHYIVYNSSYGLPNKEFFKLVQLNHSILIASDDELFFLKNNWGKIKNNYTPPSIKKILVNDVLCDRSTLNNLSYDKNRIKFLFENLNFHNGTNELRYQLIGARNDSNTVYNNELNFVDLSPGNYELIILDLKPLQNEYAKIDSIKFHIGKPFWQQIWFYLLIILLIILLAYLIIKNYFVRLRKKDLKEIELSALINNYQMAAIRAQMNPHFIFNCINSIQRYILTNDKMTAYNYLTKFSKLIRLVLNNSEEETISLKTELEMVSLYAELEQLRFENSFAFNIYTENGLDPEEYFIPPMMLQPYIENSIWHGIMHLNNTKPGQINIQVAQENEMLKIEIIDNGVGREAAMKHMVKTHQSKATKLNEKRINIINDINKKIKGSITIFDIFDENKLVVGTKVILLIPNNNE